MKVAGAALIFTLSVLCCPLSATHAQQIPLTKLPFIEQTNTAWGSVYEIAMSPDASRIALATDTGIWLLDQKLQPLEQLHAHIGSVYSVDWNAEGTMLASGGEDATIRIWDVHPNGLSLAKTIQDSGQIHTVNWSPNSASYQLATLTETFRDQASDSIFIASDLRIWNVQTGKITRTLANLANPSWGVAWNSTGTQVAGAGAIAKVGFQAFVWDVQTGDALVASISGNDRIYALAWRPDTDEIAITDETGAIPLVDVSLAQPAYFFGYDIGQIRSIAWSPDGNHFAIGSWFGDLLIYDVHASTAAILHLDNPNFINSLDWSQSKPLLAIVIGGERIRLFDVSNLPMLTGTPTITPYPLLAATPTLSTSERSDT